MSLIAPHRPVATRPSIGHKRRAASRPPQHSEKPGPPERPTHSSGAGRRGPSGTHRLMVLSSVSGFVCWMYLFPNWFTPRGQPVCERLGGTTDIAAQHPDPSSNRRHPPVRPRFLYALPHRNSRRASAATAGRSRPALSWCGCAGGKRGVNREPRCGVRAALWAPSVGGPPHRREESAGSGRRLPSSATSSGTRDCGSGQRRPGPVGSSSDTVRPGWTPLAPGRLPSSPHRLRFSCRGGGGGVGPVPVRRHSRLPGGCRLRRSSARRAARPRLPWAAERPSLSAAGGPRAEPSWAWPSRTALTSSLILFHGPLQSEELGESSEPHVAALR